ncbi:MAG: UDP-galactopyranose mutase [Ignavibacteriaceae bacterium]|nr:UDP-galactopyranose mutase [Ignavibacteriaceae bacterium]
MYDYLVVGAGFSGAVMAERLASQLNKKILIVERRNHIAGNAYDEVDDHGILVHRYGPHIFHTNSKKVFDYLSLFTEWRFYEHKVLASLDGKNYPIPINRLTINKLYNLNLKSEEEVKKFYESVKEKRNPVLNSEDVIVNQVGRDLFERFFLHYTKKQWNREPKELAPTVCGRIPVRTNEDCRYFTDKYQFMPKDGYTAMFRKMLNHPNIEVVLNTDFKKIINDVKFKKIIYTGPIDYFFDYEYDKLPYRSIRFEYKSYAQNVFQESAVVNYVERGVEFSRVTEYKHLTGQIADTTTLSFEYFQEEGEPYYPVPTYENISHVKKYSDLASKIESVQFLGRLAEYQYYNIDQVVARILDYLERLLND